MIMQHTSPHHLLYKKNHLLKTQFCNCQINENCVFVNWRFLLGVLIFFSDDQERSKNSREDFTADFSNFLFSRVIFFDTFRLGTDIIQKAFAIAKSNLHVIQRPA